MADLQSRIRFTAVADAALKTIRDLKREVTALNKAEAGADVGPGRAELAAAQAAKLADKRNAAAEAKRLARETGDAEKTAARDAAAATKAAAAEGLAARRSAAAEARKLAAQVAADEKKERLAKETGDRTAAAASLRTTRQAREQQRQLSFQVTDIGVGLATGQSPFYVLLQQGGQLKDTFGSIGGAAKALLGIFTPLRLVIGGVAGALAAIGLAAIAGERESAALNKTLALTGNIAGTSLGQLNQLAQQIASGQNAAIGSVRDTLAALLASGSVTQTSLAATARAVTALQKLTADSSEDAIKAFDGQADNVTEWAIKSNKAYNYLTAQQVDYIRTLQAQGREQEAIKFANETLANTLTQRTGPALGTLETLWNSLKKAVSGYKDALLDVGRDTTPEEEIEKLKTQLSKLQRGTGKRGGASSQSFIDESAAERKSLEARIALQQKGIDAQRVRTDKQAAAAIKNQKEIFEGTKAYTDAIAGLSAAGAQVELANTQAALDKKQSAIERQNARGLLSANDYALKINAIDQQRLRAQEATLERQIKLETNKKPVTPIDGIAQQAAVKQLQAQLTGIRAEIGKSTSKNQEIVSAGALEDANRAADQYQAVWQRATTAVAQLTRQNAQTQADAITDPIERAAEVSRLATEDLRNQFDQLRLALTIQLDGKIDPAQRAQIEAQIQSLADQSKKAIDETARKATFDSLNQQYGELITRIETGERGIDAAVQRGEQTTVAAEAAKFEARAQALPQLQAILDKLREIAGTPAERNAVEGANQRVIELKASANDLENTFRSSVGSGFSQVFRDIASGAQTAQGAVTGFISGIAQSMLDVISKRLGASLLESLLPSGGGAGGGGGFGGFISTAASTVGKFFGFFHSGGVVGRAGGDRRSVPPAAFAFAPRYHSGGIAGLRGNEVPAILQQGEEVLTADDPRHRRNYQGSGANVSINVSVSGAQGSAAQQQSAGNDLGTILESAVQAGIDRWATRQSRSGGLLAKQS